MSEFGRQLKELRIRSGFRSAKAFYENLRTGRRLEFNYSYYMRIENGDALPSSQVVNSLASLMAPQDADVLIQAYCQSLFPKHARLFSYYQEPGRTTAPKRPKGPLVQTQTELTRRQVSVLSLERENYYLFLLVTLARTPVRVSALKTFFPSAKFSRSLRQLKEAELLIENKDELAPSSVEIRFPDATDTELKAAYKQLDLWDHSFGDHFELESLIQKLLIRRISFRYLSLIQGQIQLLSDLVKASDETDLKYNDKVMQLSISLKCGKLPG